MQVLDTTLNRFVYNEEKTLSLLFTFSTSEAEEVSYEEEYSRQISFLETDLQKVVQDTLEGRCKVELNSMQGWPPHFILQKIKGENFSDEEIDSLHQEVRGVVVQKKP